MTPPSLYFCTSPLSMLLTFGHFGYLTFNMWSRRYSVPSSSGHAIIRSHYHLVTPSFSYTSVSQSGLYRLPWGRCFDIRGSNAKMIGGGAVVQNGQLRDYSVVAVAATVKVE